MATRTDKKTAAQNEATVDTSLLERRIEQLREQLQNVATERDAIRAELTAATAKKKREPKPFAARNYPLNGFKVSITGKGCMEDEIVVEAVGDTIVIHTGDAADAARSGVKHVVATAAPAAARSAARPDEGESWSNVDNQITGIGAPKRKLTPEEKAVAMKLPPNELDAYLDSVEGSIISSKGQYAPS